MDKRELIEFDSELPDEVRKNLVPAKAILTEHRKRWAVMTSRGYVVIKKISKFDRDDLSMQLMRDPEYARLAEDYKPLWNTIKAKGELSGEDMQRLVEMGAKMAVKQRIFTLACIQEPAWVKTLEDLDGLLSSLPDAEAVALYNVLTEAVAPGPETRISGGVLAMAQRFGIPLPGDLTLENMTGTQADALIGEMEDEAHAVVAARERFNAASKPA